MKQPYVPKMMNKKTKRHLFKTKMFRIISVHMKHPHNTVLDTFVKCGKMLIFRIGTKLYEQYKY